MNVVKVRVDALYQSNTPFKGFVRFKLSRPNTGKWSNDDKIILPQIWQDVKLDANGKAVVELIPNDLLYTDSFYYYQIVCHDENHIPHIMQKGQIIVPNYDANNVEVPLADLITAETSEDLQTATAQAARAASYAAQSRTYKEEAESTKTAVDTALSQVDSIAAQVSDDRYYVNTVKSSLTTRFDSLEALTTQANNSAESLSSTLESVQTIKSGIDESLSEALSFVGNCQSSALSAQNYKDDAQASAEQAAQSAYDASIDANGVASIRRNLLSLLASSREDLNAMANSASESSSQSQNSANESAISAQSSAQSANEAQSAAITATTALTNASAVLSSIQTEAPQAVQNIRNEKSDAIATMTSLKNATVTSANEAVSSASSASNSAISASASAATASNAAQTVNSVITSATVVKATSITDDGVYQIPTMDDVPLSVKSFGAKGDGATDDTIAIQSAINSASLQHRSLFFPAGEYIVTSTIKLPVKNEHYGAVELLGECDQYAFGIRRVADSDGVFKYPVWGTVISFNPSTDSNLFEHNLTFVSIKNISFRDCDSQRKPRNVNSFALNASTLVSGSDNRSRYYISRCSFIGFKSVLGSTATLERIAYHITESRFAACSNSLINGIDSLVENSAFSGGEHAVVFDELPNGSSGSGASTVSQCRIEWTRDAGILIKSEYVRDVLITGNEFDRCGGPGVAITAGYSVNITNNVFRRNGANNLTVYGNDSQHIYLSNCSDIVIVGNSTVKKNSSDSGNGTNIPNVAYYINHSSCNNVIMEGNNWRGCVKPQGDIGFSISIPAGDIASFPINGFTGYYAFCVFGKQSASGTAFLSSANGLAVKHFGGDNFLAKSESTLDDVSALTDGCMYVSMKANTVYMRNTSANKFTVFVKGI